LTLNLCAKLSHLHGVVGRHRRLRLELLCSLSQLRKLVGKPAKLLLNELLNFQDELDLFTRFIANKLLIFSLCARLRALR
jgi:hypothetical protein